MPSADVGEPDKKRVRFDGEVVPDTDENEETKKKVPLSAKDVVELRFVRSRLDVGTRGASGDHAPGLTYHPSYLHQIIPNEEVHGYKNAIVAVYVHLGSLTYWLDSSLEPLPREAAEDSEVETTNIEALLTPFIKSGLTATRTQFLAAVQSPPSLPLTNLVATYQHKECSYAVYKERLFEVDSVKGGMVKREAFHEFHRRMSFLMFVHIDGASFIDDEDPRWEVFVIVQLENNEPLAFIGYATTYPFAVMQRTEKDGISFVDRIRISQVAITPLFQRQGHGGRLIEAIYEDAHARHAMEITVEDPSRGFRIIRDCTDLRWAYRKAVLPASHIVLYEDEIKLKTELQSKLLITSTQGRRCLEIHQLRFIDRTKEEMYKKYRLWVKRRLFNDYVDELERFDADERKEKLGQLYDELEEEYLLSARRVSAFVASEKGKTEGSD